MSAKIIAAISIDDFMQKTFKEQKVIRYREETGEKYEKIVKETVYKIGNKIITSPLEFKGWREFHTILYNLEIWEELDLYVYPQEGKPQFIYKTLGYEFMEISLKDIDNKLKETIDLLEKKGFDPSKVKLYLLSDDYE